MRGIRLQVRWVLPFFASLYYIFGQFLDFPKIDEVVGTTVILITLLGIFLKFKDKDEDFDGDMIVENRKDGTKLASLALGSEPEELFNKNRVVFKVIKKIPSSAVTNVKPHRTYKHSSHI